MFKISGKIAFSLIAILIALALIICGAYAFSSPAVSINTSVSYSAPPGSEGNPYLINSIEDFNSLVDTYKDDPSTYLKLNSNLSESNGTLSRYDFNGNLDFNNKIVEIEDFPIFNSIGGTVKNAKINVLSAIGYNNQFGALAYAASGTIENCSLNSFAPTTLNSIGVFGGLLSRSSGANIINCSNNANISLTLSNQIRFGSIVGEIISSSVIMGCENNGTISISSSASSTSYFGGLIGYSSQQEIDVEIANCKNNAPISITCSYSSSNYFSRLGGIMGGATANVNLNMHECCNLANLNCTNSTNNASYGVQVGGLISYIFGTDSNTATISIENCYSTGNITGQNSNGGGVHIGGILGFGYSDDTANKNPIVSIKTSYSSGTFSANGASNKSIAGGIIGQSEKTTLTSCFSSANIISGTTIGGLIGIYKDASASYPCTLVNCLGSAYIEYMGNSNNIGGLIGESNSDPVLTDCHFNNTHGVKDLKSYGATRAIGNKVSTDYGASNLEPFYESFFSYNACPWDFDIWEQSEENPLDLNFI